MRFGVMIGYMSFKISLCPAQYFILYLPFLTIIKKIGANTKQKSRNFKQSFNDFQSYDQIYFFKNFFMSGITFYTLLSKPDHEKI